MTKRLLLIGLVFCCCAASHAQSNFIIPVNASNGQAIAGATVTLTCLSGGCGTNSYVVNTDNTGNAQFTNVVTGRYTVTISGTRIVPYSYTFDVASTNPSQQNGTIFVDGVTYPQNGAGITAAVLAACGGPGGTKNGRVFLPAGTYPISSTGLNMTNMTGCTIEGASAYASIPGDSGKTGTVLQFNYAPGAGTAGIDISGSTDLTFKHIVFSCGTSTANAPTVCFLHGRTSGSNGIQNKLEDSFVVGYSPWIYYNYHGEQFSSIDTAYVEYATTGVPITLSIANTAGITSPFVTFGGSNSETIESFTGTKTIASSQSTGSYPANLMLYIDEAAGHIDGVTFNGYVNEINGTGNTIIGDTTGATGTIENLDASIQADIGSATSNKLVTMNGTAFAWNLRGKINPVNNTGGPALGFSNLYQSNIRLRTNITNSISGTQCNGSILQVDGPNTTVTCFAAAMITSDAAGVGSNFAFLQSGGNQFSANLTGTGACATFSTQTGGQWAGRATCTGTTGASTFIITPGFTANTGWICSAFDQTTRANLLQQTSTSQTACTLTATSITQNDVIVFSAFAF